MGTSNEKVKCPSVVVTKRGPCQTREQQLDQIQGVNIEEIDAAIKDTLKDKSA